MLLSLVPQSPLNMIAGGGDGNAYAASSKVNMRVHGIFLGSQPATSSDSGDAVGDATLIESNGKYLLIDTGDSSSSVRVISYLKKVGATNIDILITHLHGDHYGGLNAILKKTSGITVGTVYLPDMSLGEEFEKYGLSSRYARLEKYVSGCAVKTGQYVTDAAISNWVTETTSSAVQTTESSVMPPDPDATYAAIYAPSVSVISEYNEYPDAWKLVKVSAETTATTYECIASGTSLEPPDEPGSFVVEVPTDGGLSTVITTTAVTEMTTSTGAYHKTAVLARTTQTKYVKKGYSFKVGKAKIDVIGPVGKYTINQFKSQDGECGLMRNHYLNNYSLSLMIKAGARKYFTGGDIEAAEEKALLKKYGKKYLNADAMKLNHHGLRTSSTANFMSAVSPTFSYVPNSGYYGYGGGKLKYIYVHSARATASKYGLVYLVGNEQKNLIMDFCDARIDIRKSSVDAPPLKGWVTVYGGYTQYWKKDKYYINPGTGKPVKGYFTYGGKRYYMGTGGCMERAFYNSSGKYQYWRSYGSGKVRYYDKNGRYYKGFKAIGKYRYLFSSKGYRLTGVQKAGGKYYVFDRLGHMYKNRKIKVGAYTLKASASGRVKLPLPKAAKAAQLKAMGGKRLLFSYAQGAISDMSGYQVQYSYSKKFTKSATRQMFVAKALNKTRTKTLSRRMVAIAGLKKGKTCYVRVRAYRKYGGITVYGKFSKALRTKVK